MRPTLLVLLLLFTSCLAAQSRPASTADFDRWMKDLSNWGRWGKSDELGTLNLITPATRLAAAKLVREGIAVSLSHDAEKEPAPDNSRPFVHEMISSSETPGDGIFRDSFSVAHHGIAHTHLDAPPPPTPSPGSSSTKPSPRSTAS